MHARQAPTALLEEDPALADRHRGGLVRPHPVRPLRPDQPSQPAATNPFQWTDPKAKAVAKASCYDCHSNETKWWWATNIAPFSWLVQRDVDDGRARLNFSEWTGEPSAARIEEAVTARCHRSSTP